MEQGFDRGNYGRVLKAIEEKHICPICGKAWDTQKEAVEKFFENHSVEEFESE